MKRTKWSNSLILGIVGSVVASTAGFVLLAYTRTGRRGKASPFLPRKLVKQIDKLVSWLDGHFGKKWVDRGMDAIQAALSGTAPAMLMRLLEPVFEAEILGRKKHWSGTEKLRHVVHSFGPN